MHLTNKILRFIRNIFALLLLATGVFAQPNENLIEGVMAVVGKNIVLKSEADAQYEAFKRQSIDGQDITKCRVLEELLFQKLLVHHAEIDSVTVGEEEVEGNMDRSLQQLIAQMGGDSRKLEEYYGKSIIEIKEEMRPLMTEQLTAQRMQMSITEGVEVTPTEIQEFYNSIPQDSLPLINTEVEVAQIVKYPEVSPEAEKEVKDKLNELKNASKMDRAFQVWPFCIPKIPDRTKMEVNTQVLSAGSL
jgi:peptidyl-prolyl cis-trans isomerase SurA